MSWLADQGRAIDQILENGRPGEIYNISGHNEKHNLDVVKLICQELGKSEDLIEHVTDRKGHDLRYAMDSTKIREELGWVSETKFEDGIRKTIRWYLDHEDWWEEILNRENQRN